MKRSTEYFWYFVVMCSWHYRYIVFLPVATALVAALWQHSFYPLLYSLLMFATIPLVCLYGYFFHKPKNYNP